MYLECIAIRWSYRRTSLIAGNLRQEVRHRHKYWYSSTETDLMRRRQPRGEVLIVIPAVMLITSRSCRARSVERGRGQKSQLRFRNFLLKSLTLDGDFDFYETSRLWSCLCTTREKIWPLLYYCLRFFISNAFFLKHVIEWMSLDTKNLVDFILITYYSWIIFCRDSIIQAYYFISHI